MGFNKCYLPDSKTLARQIKSNGLTEYLKDKQKVEAFLGPADSMKIMETVVTARKHAMPDDKIMLTLATTYPEHFN